MRRLLAALTVVLLVVGIGQAVGATAPGALVFRGYNNQGFNAHNGKMADYATYSGWFNPLTPDFTGLTNTDGRLTLNWPSTAGETYGGLGFHQLDDYVARMTGYIDIPAAGTYNFRSRSDDGSKVWVDKNGDGTGWTEVVSNLGWQGMTTRGGLSVTFAAPGWYGIDTGHYEGGGDSGMIVEWDQGSGTWAVVDQSTLSTVPEPSTFVLLGMGAIGLLGYAWRTCGTPASVASSRS